MGGGSYANVMLVGNSLSPGPITPSLSPQPSPSPAIETKPSVSTPAESILEATSDNTTKNPTPMTATVAAVTKGGPSHPETRNDSKSSTDDSGSDNSDNSTPEEEENEENINGDYAGEKPEEDDDEDYEDEGDDNDLPSHSGKALNGQ
ncbi:hypothetical protein FBU30_005295, partial [Linnemannia zychae]